MNNQGMSYIRALLVAAMASGMAAWGGGKPEEKNPVKVVFTSVGMEKDKMWFNDQTQESVPKLKIGVKFIVKEPLGFFSQYDGGTQYLEATDSTGKKLAPVEFKMDSWDQQSEKGTVQASVRGVAAEPPSPGVSWIRLKGVLRVPLSHSMQSPVYELPLAKGAEMHVLLPGIGVREDAGIGDIVMFEDVPSGRLFLKEYRSFEKDGKKMIEVELGLAVESPFDLDHFEILNEKDKMLKVGDRGGSFSLNSPFREWTNRLQFEAPENLQKLRFRMVYNVPQEPVAVPVDVKVGMRGEIREKKK